MARLERSSCRPTVVTSRLDSIILKMSFFGYFLLKKLLEI